MSLTLAYKNIESLIGNKEYDNSLDFCKQNDLTFLETLIKSAVFLEKQKEVKKSDKIIVKLLCNWTSSEELCKLWNKMSKGGFTWGDIRITWKDTPSPDYFVVINSPPPRVYVDKAKTILFRMEPFMEKQSKWGEWSNPSGDFFFKGLHENHYNNNEWHLSKTYNELMKDEIKKDSSLDKTVSVVLSKKYSDIGHIKRIDFTKFTEDQEGVDFHVFGDNKYDYKHFKGGLPPYQKDLGLFPYKYTFNTENNFIDNYYTEKLIDAILAECLCFYKGPPNIMELIDPRAYVQLSLSNFKKDYGIINKAVEENLWEERIGYIREAKKKILNETGFFPRLEKIIKEGK